MSGPAAKKAQPIVVKRIKKAAHGHHGGAQFLGLRCGVDGNIARARDNDLGTIKGLAMGLHHFIGEIDRAKACGLGTNQGTAPGQAFASKDTGFMLGSQAAVLTKEEADLAAADANITSWNIAVFSDVAVQLRHKRLAEAHDFHLGPALGIKVRTALATANGQAGQGIFEDLLKTEELNDAQVDRRMETQSALVGAERRIELDAKTAIDLDITIVIDPRHAEDELALRFTETLHQAVVRVLRVFF